MRTSFAVAMLLAGTHAEEVAKLNKKNTEMVIHGFLSEFVKSEDLHEFIECAVKSDKDIERRLNMGLDSWAKRTQFDMYAAVHNYAMGFKALSQALNECHDGAEKNKIQLTMLDYGAQVATHPRHMEVTFNDYEFNMNNHNIRSPLEDAWQNFHDTHYDEFGKSLAQAFTEAILGDMELYSEEPI